MGSSTVLGPDIVSFVDILALFVFDSFDGHGGFDSNLGFLSPFWSS